METNLSRGMRKNVREQLGASRREMEDQKIKADAGFAMEKIARLYALDAQEIQICRNFWSVRRGRLDGEFETPAQYREAMEAATAAMRDRPTSNNLNASLRFLDAIFSKQY